VAAVSEAPVLRDCLRSETTGNRLLHGGSAWSQSQRTTVLAWRFRGNGTRRPAWKWRLASKCSASAGKVGSFDTLQYGRPEPAIVDTIIVLRGDHTNHDSLRGACAIYFDDGTCPFLGRCEIPKAPPVGWLRCHDVQCSALSGQLQKPRAETDRALEQPHIKQLAWTM
jgi:hypothetical protein